MPQGRRLLARARRLDYAWEARTKPQPIYDVVLHGTWQRPNTAGFLVDTYRDMVEHRFGRTKVTRGRRSNYSYHDGRFEVHMEVFAANAAEALVKAKHQLNAYLQHQACRPPKLSFT